jgi:hypothetical protein
MPYPSLGLLNTNFGDLTAQKVFWLSGHSALAGCDIRELVYPYFFGKPAAPVGTR